MIRLMFFVILVAFVTVACGQGAMTVERERVIAVDGGSYKVVTVAQLKSMLDRDDLLLVNVHIPYAGEIGGTDLFVPYDAIEQNLGKLPADKETKIVVYCRSGQMSKIAARTLTRLGYRNIVDVEGGMAAWDKAGYQLSGDSSTR